MKATTKEMLRRAFRTFIQAAFSYLSVNLVYVVSGAENDFNLIKDGLLCLQISATAAGLAAVMNLPKFQTPPAVQETPSEEEGENIYEDEDDMK